jgi:2-polyprenyl-3-methyl-5-hydroxy-6-metoxy-1,4-benzoquinol methylase
MVERVVDEQFRGRLDRVRCLDVGCHERYYSVAMAPKGMREVRGIDVRQSSLTKARFVAELLGLKNVTYEECNIEDLSSEIGPYDLCLCLGLLYHLENPVLSLRKISSITGEVCIIETQVVDEVEGSAEWGGARVDPPVPGHSGPHR